MAIKGFVTEAESNRQAQGLRKAFVKLKYSIVEWLQEDILRMRMPSRYKGRKMIESESVPLPMTEARQVHFVAVSNTSVGIVSDAAMVGYTLVDLWLFCTFWPRLPSLTSSGC